jgi:hypothetical protein
MKADVIRIKQYKKSAEQLKEEAVRIADRELHIQSLKDSLTKLYEADIHATVCVHGPYDGHTKVSYIDTKSGQEYAISPDGHHKTIRLEKVGDEKQIRSEN